ncbi:MAG: hypothetical protein AAF558_08225 [Verrucomicrobiota bacterium]
MELPALAERPASELRGSVFRIIEERAEVATAELDDDRHWIPHRELEFDQQGRIVSLRQYSLDGTCILQTYRYNNHGLSEIETRFEEGDLIKTEACIYDEFGNLIGEKHISGTGSLNMSVQITLDDQDRMIERRHFNPDGKLGVRYVYSYNEQGRLHELVGFEQDSIIDRKNFMYDSDGLVKDVEIAEFFSSTVSVFQYDVHQAVALWLDPEAEIDHWKGKRQEFRYDSQGNWVTMRRYDIFVEGSNIREYPREAYRRSIIYF